MNYYDDVNKIKLKHACLGCSGPRARPFSPSGTDQHKGVLQYRERQSAHGAPSYMDQRKRVLEYRERESLQCQCYP